MKRLAVIGERDEAIEYTDRPTVKVIIEDGNRVLILNDGLLPGGGVEAEKKIGTAIGKLKNANPENLDGDYQGKLYNRMTSLAILRAYN